jgi:DNA-directed RNA polymerase subunit RPC12/RpoP
MKTLDEHNLDRFEQIAATQRGEAGNNIACPHCGNEMHDINSGMALCSDPPRVSVKCGKCGYSGSRVI